MPKSVYVETTIPSYLVSHPSRDLVQCARQQITRRWWHDFRHEYTLKISQIVVDECAAGDADAAARRLAELQGIELLELTSDVVAFASAIMKSGLLPDRAARDAVHIAAASVHELDLLVTWNCKHIANATILRDLEELARNAGYAFPVVCTPDELVGD